jgi:hypothetical protein
MSEWILEESPFFASRFRKYQKKHSNETAAVLNNLDTYVRTLNMGVKPELIQASFIHREPQGVVAIDQKGVKGSPRQTRLYVYALVASTALYLITIGDKNSQKRDIQDCRQYVTSLQKEG